ncbi:MAG: dTDP-4-dehydrorhamnose reductase [Crocinitomicaceae bacterium]|nr:dTDP-4-dehydrorhamnose reductase [Crocinitomicaceae bacterium]
MQGESTEKKIIVTGANGQLGHDFRALEYIFSDFSFLFLSKLEFDISLEHRVHEFIAHEKPDAVINCAAYTNVERAEDEPENALLVNATSAGFLADACKESGSLLVHFSTDYVFDGLKNKPYNEDDPVNPVSAYGRSKLAGERLIDEKLKRHIILRTSWMYSSYGHNFYKTIVRLAKENGVLNVVGDQVSSPTYARHLAHDVLDLLTQILVEQKHFEYGIYHYSQEGTASWWDFAREIVMNKKLFVPVNKLTTPDFPAKAKRPAYSKLDNSKFIRNTGIRPLSWKEGLTACIYNDFTENEHNH